MKIPLHISQEHTGFTLIEALVVISIIGVLASVLIIPFIGARDDARLKKAQSELREYGNAAVSYFTNNRTYPPNAAPPNAIPAELEPYITTVKEPPFGKSFYDYDNWDLNGDGNPDVIQFSLRFCDPNNISDCEFPDGTWAENFTSANNALFYCVEGPCRSINTEPRNFPGYCINCGCKQMEDPACGY